MSGDVDMDGSVDPMAEDVTTLTDRQREDLIDIESLKLACASTPAARRKAWESMKRLIAGRSNVQQVSMAINQALPYE